MTAHVVPMSFRQVESQEVPKKAPAPLDPWKTKNLKVSSAAEVFFTRLDGEGERGKKLRRHREIEREREQKLAEKAAEVERRAQEEGLARGRDEGFRQGLAEGREQGMAEVQAELEQLKGALDSALSSLVTARADLVTKVELDLAQIVLDLAQGLAGGAISVEPERIVELARQGMSLLAESDVMTIRTAPLASELLRTAGDSLSAALNIDSLRIVEDPSLEPDGCIVESNLGRVDLRVTQRLKAARDLLHSVRNEE